MRVTLSSFSKAVLKVFLYIFLCALAEEHSILEGASVSQYDIHPDYTWNLESIIDGNFKSIWHLSFSDIDASGKKEIQIILAKEQKIISAFVANCVYFLSINPRIGTTQIYAGNDSANFSNQLTKCS